MQHPHPESLGQIHQADNLPLLRQLPPASIRLIYIDPPSTPRKPNAAPAYRPPPILKAPALASPAPATPPAPSPPPTTPTPSTTSPPSSAPVSKRPIASSPPTAPSSSTSTPAKSTTSKSSSTPSSAAPPSSTRSSGPTTTGPSPPHRWPAKHDNILWYAKDPANYVFNRDSIDRIPYMAPDLVGPEKAALGKIPTDVWWLTIVPTNSREKTGYPTQKPLKLLNRIVQVHSHPGDTVLDFFAGSGTTGEAAARSGRRFHLIDQSPDAVRIMAQRLAFAYPTLHLPEPGPNPPKPPSRPTQPAAHDLQSPH